MLEIEGIVIKTTPYKERDAIIEIITQDGFFSFLARGIMKVDSKNALFVSLYTHARFELEEGKGGHYSLRSGTLLDSPANSMNDLYCLLAFSNISELALKFFDEKSAAAYYPYLFEAFQGLYHKEGDPFTLVGILAAKALQLSGYAVETKGCVECGNKSGIVSFDFHSGGFLCHKHFNPNTQKNQTPSYLKTVRFLFVVKKEEMLQYTMKEKDLIAILSDMKNFMYDASGVNWKGLDLWSRAIRKS